MELHFYCRATKKEDLDSFASKKNIKHLGVPDLKGHGSFIHRKKKLRFIVMPRYGTDLQTRIDESESKSLSLESTSHLATQIIDSLEYLHSQGYVHKDLKANNMIFQRDQKKGNYFLNFKDLKIILRFFELLATCFQENVTKFLNEHKDHKANNMIFKKKICPSCN